MRAVHWKGSVREDELGLVVDLGPVGVQEGDGLLVEGLLGHLVEVGQGLGVKLLSERHAGLVRVVGLCVFLAGGEERMKVKAK